MTHTPTPWRYEPFKHRTAALITSDTGPIASMGGGRQGMNAEIHDFDRVATEREANAAFIVKAVNAYDDLVAVARILADLETEDCGRKFPTKEQCFAARAALAKAEGK